LRRGAFRVCLMSVLGGRKAAPDLSGWLSAQLHFVDAPADERWRRVQERNARRGAQGSLPFDVTREMFDFVETMWEPPTDQEMAACDGVRLST
jgi:hypothetical protein